MKNHIPLAFAILSSLSAHAATDKNLCPKILTASGIKLGVETDSLFEMYRNMNDEGGWLFDGENQNSHYSIQPSRTKNLRISIEEQSPNAAAQKKLALECPVALEWQKKVVPKIKFSYPNAIQNVSETSVVSYKKIVNGISFSSLTGSLETLYITVYWKMFEPILDGTADVPAFIDPQTLSQTNVSIPSEEPSPVKGVRFSSSPRFFNFWHLLTKKDAAELQEQNKHYFGIDDKNSAYFNMSLAEASRITYPLAILTHWDSEKKKAVECLTTATPQDKNSCFRLNYRIYKPVLEAIDSGLPFYMQTLIKLSDGYTLNTYKIQAAGQKVELVGTELVANTETLGVPAEDL